MRNYIIPIFVFSLVFLIGCAQPPNIASPSIPSETVSGTPYCKYIIGSDFPISSPYGMRNGRPHHGIDIARYPGDESIPRGAKLRVEVLGEVVRSASHSGYGNTIDVLLANGERLRFAHLNKRNVAVGDSVSPGTVIGEIGDTGDGGVHLHYEIRIQGGADFSGAIDEHVRNPANDRHTFSIEDCRKRNR